MKIAWLVNIMLPEYLHLSGRASLPYGGWLEGAANQIAKGENAELVVFMIDKQVHKGWKVLQGKKIIYVGIPDLNNWSIFDSKLFFIEILKHFSPDVVDVRGSENTHSYAMLLAVNELNVAAVLTIQGLVGACAKHFETGLPAKAISGNTFRDLVRGNMVSGLKKKFAKKGLVEQKSIETAKFIVGRTSFDSAYTKLLNPAAIFFHCGEILRSSFYSNSWVANERKNKIIFVSQASYPIKGFHLAIESLALIKKFFPEVKLRVAGLNIYKDLKLIDRLKISYYGKYINNRIRQLGLMENIEFLGELNESQMLVQYLDADVFLSPSTIENSSNSLGEAMSLGLPCVASYVGGTPDLVKHGENGFLYQSDAPYMCAYYIVEILKDYKLAVLLSENARKFASGWVSQKEVSERTFEIYRECLAHSTAAIQN